MEFPSSDFDNWAADYDRSVSAGQGFPFEGYADLVNRMVEIVDPRPGLTVLDLGTGTGNLAVPLSKAGCELWCTDFSESMLEIARSKLPGARFYHHDIRTSLPAELPGVFDRIISAYVLHHFNLNEKVRIVQRLLTHLTPAGRFIIGDIMFRTHSEMEKVKAKLGHEWDEEYYWMVDESLAEFAKFGIGIQYLQINSYTGILQVFSQTRAGNSVLN